MCPPVVAAVMAVSAMASAALSIKSQNDQAKAQVDAANKAADADYAALEVQQTEIQDAAAVERMRRIRQGLLERAVMRVNAGEAGLSGVTPTVQQQTSLLDESLDLSHIEQNKTSRLLQNSRGINAVRATNEGRLTDARSRMTSRASAALQIGISGTQGGVQGYSAGTTMKRR